MRAVANSRRNLHRRVSLHRLTLLPASAAGEDRVEVLNLDTFERVARTKPRGARNVGEMFTQLTGVPCASWYEVSERSFIVIGHAQ